MLSRYFGREDKERGRLMHVAIAVARSAGCLRVIPCLSDDLLEFFGEYAFAARFTFARDTI